MIKTEYIDSSNYEVLSFSLRLLTSIYKTNKNINGIYINYLFKELPQLEGEQKESDIEKYLPWSKDLPQDMKNYDGEYKELNIEE